MCELGLDDEYGQLNVNELDGRTISPDLQQLGERRIRHWLNEGQLTAMQLLDEHRELLEKIANMLIERESLYADEIKQLFS